MNKYIYIYWLVYIPEKFIGIAERIVNEQLSLLKSSLLYDNCKQLTIGVISGEEYFLKIKTTILDGIGSNTEKIHFIHTKQNLGEGLILRKIYEDCIKSESDDYILYFHTKGMGVSVLNQPLKYVHKFLWRRAAETFLIGNWKKCLNVMDEDPSISICAPFVAHSPLARRGGSKLCDCMTREQKEDFLNHRNIYNIKHNFNRFLFSLRRMRISGNFWWTKTSYIKTIPEDIGYKFTEPANNGARDYHEMFITKGRIPYFVFSPCDNILLSRPIRNSVHSTSKHIFAIQEIFNNLFFDQ